MTTVKQTITDAEYEIMRILWKAEKKMTVADVVRALEGNDWTASTVSTFLQRLLKKGRQSVFRYQIICKRKQKEVKYNYSKGSEFSIVPFRGITVPTTAIVGFCFFYPHFSPFATQAQKNLENIEVFDIMEQVTRIK